MSDIIQQQREIVARHIRGENERDWEVVYGTFVQDDRARITTLCHSALCSRVSRVFAPSTGALRLHSPT